MAQYLVVPPLAPPPGYAHAAIVEAGERLVFTAGAVPLDATGTLVGDGDLRAQTEQVLTNLESALQAAGSSLERVVTSAVYVATTDASDLVTVWDIVRESGLSGGPHTSTLIGVSCLGYRGQLVEITAVATADQQS